MIVSSAVCVALSIIGFISLLIHRKPFRILSLISFIILCISGLLLPIELEKYQNLGGCYVMAIFAAMIIATMYVPKSRQNSVLMIGISLAAFTAWYCMPSFKGIGNQVGFNGRQLLDILSGHDSTELWVIMFSACPILSAFIGFFSPKPKTSIFLSLILLFPLFLYMISSSDYSGFSTDVGVMWYCFFWLIFCGYNIYQLIPTATSTGDSNIATTVAATSSSGVIEDRDIDENHAYKFRLAPQIIILGAISINLGLLYLLQSSYNNILYIIIPSILLGIYHKSGFKLINIGLIGIIAVSLLTFALLMYQKSLIASQNFEAIDDIQKYFHICSLLALAALVTVGAGARNISNNTVKILYYAVLGVYILSYLISWLRPGAPEDYMELINYFTTINNITGIVIIFLSCLLLFFGKIEKSADTQE